MRERRGGEKVESEGERERESGATCDIPTEAKYHLEYNT